MALTLETLDPHGPVYGPADRRHGGLTGVLLLHGAEGPMAGWSHRFAAILAAHGVLALPWSYGEGDFFGSGAIRDVDIAPALDALAALRAHPRCARAGLFGWSKGAELALLLASCAPDAADFVAAHAPADRVTGAFDPDHFRATGETASADGAPAWRWAGHAAALKPGTPIAAHRITAPVFLSHGTADDIRDPAMTRSLATRLERAGNPPDLFIAEGQGHAFDFDHEPILWQRLLAFFRERA